VRSACVSRFIQSSTHVSFACLKATLAAASLLVQMNGLMNFGDCSLHAKYFAFLIQFSARYSKNRDTELGKRTLPVRATRTIRTTRAMLPVRATRTTRAASGGEFSSAFREKDMSVAMLTYNYISQVDAYRDNRSSAGIFKAGASFCSLILALMFSHDTQLFDRTRLLERSLLGRANADVEALVPSLGSSHISTLGSS
jgi:hypothetical protein